MSSIASQFHEIRRRLVEEGKPPVRVIFSQKGYYKAMAENGGGNSNQMPDSYMGLPYTVRSDMAGDIGLDYKFESREDAITVRLAFNASSRHVLVDGKPHGEPVDVLQIVGSTLTNPQLCDIIMAFIQGAKERTRFHHLLESAVTNYGRFE